MRRPPPKTQNNPIGDGTWIGRVEFAVEVQEREAVHECPDCGRQGFRVRAGEGALDDGSDVGGDRGGCCNAFGAVSVAWLAEHHAEQRGPLEGELDVRDGDGGEIVWRGRRGVNSRERFGEFLVAHGSDRGQERVAIGVVAVWRRCGDARPARDRSKRQLGRTALFEDFKGGAHQRRAQITVVVRRVRG